MYRGKIRWWHFRWAQLCSVVLKATPRTLFSFSFFPIQPLQPIWVTNRNHTLPLNAKAPCAQPANTPLPKSRSKISFPPLTVTNSCATNAKLPPSAPPCHDWLGGDHCHSRQLFFSCTIAEQSNIRRFSWRHSPNQPSKRGVTKTPDILRIHILQSEKIEKTYWCEKTQDVTSQTRK